MKEENGNRRDENGDRQIEKVNYRNKRLGNKIYNRNDQNALAAPATIIESSKKQTVQLGPPTSRKNS